MVTNTTQLLFTQELIDILENNQSMVMFPFRDKLIESTLRSDSAYGFANTLQKYPTVYATDVVDDVFRFLNLSKVLTEYRIVFIGAEEDAIDMWDINGV